MSTGAKWWHAAKIVSAFVTLVIAAMTSFDPDVDPVARLLFVLIAVAYLLDRVSDLLEDHLADLRGAK